MSSDFSPDAANSWKIERETASESTPLLAAAVHDGHLLRDEISPLAALDEAGRLREEDPFTAELASVAPTRIIGLRSRFEVDFNRAREKAIYQRPEDAWGLTVWKNPLSEEIVARSLAQYDGFYADVHALLEEFSQRFGKFVVLDIHSYNHHRAGPDAPYDDPQQNPEVNIGTGSLDRQRWAPVIDCLIEELGRHEYSGRRLDVRENVKFQGGEFPRWIHRHFPDAACAPAIEFKKFWMDEWSGEVQRDQLESIRAALAAAVPGVLRALEKVR